MERIVISLGGSLINPSKPDVDYLKSFSRLVKKLSKDFSIAVLAGGGMTARVYAEAVRELGGNEFIADEAATLSTRQNAILLITALGSAAYPTPIASFSKAAEAVLSGKAVVMTGTIPGISTDTDAALLAEKIGARRLVNLSKVDGVYSDNPVKNKNAKKFPAMGFQQLVSLAMKTDQRRAGTNFIFDLVACKIIARSRIETHFVNGRKLQEVERAITGQKHSGTKVS